MPVAVSDLHVIFEPSKVLRPGGGGDLQRLEDGRMAVLGTYLLPGQPNPQRGFVTTVDALNTGHSAPVEYKAPMSDTNFYVPSLTAGKTSGFALNWSRVDATANSLNTATHLRFFNDNGQAFGPVQKPSTAKSQLELVVNTTALDSGNYLVTWTDSQKSRFPSVNLDIMGRIYDSKGKALGGEFQISKSAGQQYLSKGVELADGRTFLVWGEGVMASVNGETDVRDVALKGRFVDANGKAYGPEIAVDKITAAKAPLEYMDIKGVALGNGGFAVLWQEGQSAYTSDDASVRLQMFDANGVKAGSETVIAAKAGIVDVVALANGGFAVAWVPNALTYSYTTVQMFDMNGVSDGITYELFIGGGLEKGTLNSIFALELMPDGNVMALGGYGNDGYFRATGTQVFDFGEKRLVGSEAADMLYGKRGVNDEILGLGGNDKLRGLSGADKIGGGDGNDMIDGGFGKDVLTGGNGADAFVFASALSSLKNVDTIADFSVTDDAIKLENAIFKAFAKVAANTTLAAGAFWINDTGKAHDADDRIIYNSKTGVLSYDSNGSVAGGVTAQFAILKADLALTNADFVIV